MFKNSSAKCHKKNERLQKKLVKGINIFLKKQRKTTILSRTI